MSGTQSAFKNFEIDTPVGGSVLGSGVDLGMIVKSDEVYPSQYLGIGGVIHPKTGIIYVPHAFSVISFVGDHWNDVRSLSDFVDASLIRIIELNRSMRSMRTCTNVT